VSKKSRFAASYVSSYSHPFVVFVSILPLLHYFHHPFAMEAHALRARQRVYIRYALAYRKQPSASAFGSENGDWHTRLEACVCFAICLLGASPLRGVGLSAPIYFAALRKFRFNPLRFGPPAFTKNEWSFAKQNSQAQRS
jgi:hypothetical protein